MTDHGVKKYQAEQAYSAVHTAEHEHVERQRRELLQKLTGAGLSQENLVRELSRPAGRTGHDRRRPDGPYTTGPAWSGGPLPGTGGSSAAELARLIGGIAGPARRRRCRSRNRNRSRQCRSRNQWPSAPERTAHVVPAPQPERRYDAIAATLPDYVEWGRAVEARKAEGIAELARKVGMTPEAYKEKVGASIQDIVDTRNPTSGLDRTPLCRSSRTRGSIPVCDKP